MRNNVKREVSAKDTSRFSQLLQALSTPAKKPVTWAKPEAGMDQRTAQT